MRRTISLDDWTRRRQRDNEHPMLYDQKQQQQQHDYEAPMPLYRFTSIFMLFNFQTNINPSLAPIASMPLDIDFIGSHVKIVLAL